MILGYLTLGNLSYGSIDDGWMDRWMDRGMYGYQIAKELMRMMTDVKPAQEHSNSPPLCDSLGNVYRGLLNAASAHRCFSSALQIREAGHGWTGFLGKMKLPLYIGVGKHIKLTDVHTCIQMWSHVYIFYIIYRIYYIYIILYSIICLCKYVWSKTLPWNHRNTGG